jgi:eukaryotic-like serine/threonine-protein kinase
VALLRTVREQAFRLSHPHLLTPYSWVAEDDEVLLAMDLVRGGTLHTLLGDYGRLPARFAATVLDQLLAALGAVHAAGVVHRDVKPENVLLEPTGTGAPHIRLGDFGVAVGADGMRFTAAGVAVGTYGYLAPEVMAGREADHRQDLYAAGRILRRMLVGDGADADGRPEDVSAPLWALAEALSAPDPDDRPSSAQAARALLSGFGLGLRPPALTAGGELIEVFDHTGPLPPGWGPDGLAGMPSAARRRVPVAAVVLAGVAVVAAGGATVAAIAGGSRGKVPPPPAATGPAHGPTTSTAPSPAATGPAPGPTTSAAPPPTATPTLSVSAPCGWQDVGTEERLPDGRRVRCEYRAADGTYQWKLIP